MRLTTMRLNHTRSHGSHGGHGSHGSHGSHENHGRRTRFNVAFWLLISLAAVLGVGAFIYAYRFTSPEEAPLLLAALVLLPLSGLLCLTVLYAPNAETASLFEYWQNRIPASKVPIENGFRPAGGVLCVLPGVILITSMLRFAQVILAEGMNEHAVWYAVVLLLAAALTGCAMFFGFSALSSHVTVVFMLLSSVLVQLMVGFDRPVLLWPVCGLLLALFVFPRTTARWYLYVYLLILLGVPMAEMLSRQTVPDATAMWELLGLLFVGSGLYASMDAYIDFTVQSRTKLAEATARLEEAQAVHTQKEKMAALGQLISGVAHEINTPMGAIKASAENMETSSRAMFLGLIHKTRDYTDADIEDFLTLSDLCSQSVREMRNTMETRRAKPRLMAFFNRLEPATASRIVDLLTKMEICGMEKIESNVDVFKNPKLVEMLELVQTVFPFLNATQNIRYATSRVSKIVFALKSYSHTSLENEFLSFSLIENVQNVLVLYHNQMKYGIEVIWESNEDIPPVYGNPDELGQVWSNLIQNAIQAMNGVGTLRVKIQLVPAPANPNNAAAATPTDNSATTPTTTPATTSTTTPATTPTIAPIATAAATPTDTPADNGAIHVAFTDTGGGIKQEDMPRIFETFFTTKPPGEGSGLGLDICRRIIDKHGGSISVDNMPGQGVTFNVLLPINTPPAAD